MPTPQPGALTSGKRPRREKPAASGRDFESGQNSHDGTVFQRGPDQIPRGNMTLYFKCLYHDQRVALYRRHCGIIQAGTNREVLELSKIMADRIEGTPSRKSQAAAVHISKFVLTTKDGQETELFTPKTQGAAAPAVKPPPAEDAMILGLEGADRLVRA